MAVQDLLQYSEQINTSHTYDKYLPTMYDLPSEDPEEPGVPDVFHIWQAELLSKTFCLPDYDADRIMVAADLNLYYDLEHPLWHKRPDWFAVPGVPRFYEDWDMRLSYVVWQEKVVLSIVVELLSPGTEKEDLGQISRKPGEPPSKWEVYEQILGIPWYAVFSRYTDKLRIFQLARLPDGRQRYCEIVLSGQKMWLNDLKIGLGLWHGQYFGLVRDWLRWYDKNGNWIPTQAEYEKQQAEHERQRASDAEIRAEHERQRASDAEIRAEHERQRASDAEIRAEKLAAKLKELGVSAADL